MLERPEGWPEPGHVAGSPQRVVFNQYDAPIYSIVSCDSNGTVADTLFQLQYTFAEQREKFDVVYPGFIHAEFALKIRNGDISPLLSEEHAILLKRAIDTFQKVILLGRGVTERSNELKIKDRPWEIRSGESETVRSPGYYPKEIYKGWFIGIARGERPGAYQTRGQMIQQSIPGHDYEVLNIYVKSELLYIVAVSECISLLFLPESSNKSA